MFPPNVPRLDGGPRSRRERPGRRLLNFVAGRWPFTCLFGLAVLSNIAASLFSIGYNYQLIVRSLSAEQKSAFGAMVFGNNVVMFAICLTMVGCLFWPLARCRADLLAGRPVE